MSDFDFRARLDPMRGLLGGGARRSVRPMPAPATSKSTPPAPAAPAETVRRPALVPAAPAPKPRPAPAPVLATEGTLGRLNHREKILVAALSLGAGAFEVEELVIACWRRWPESFGLRGYTTSHPNNATVLCKLCGPEGLVGNGALERITPSCYQLTRAGRRRANELAPLAAPSSDVPKSEVLAQTPSGVCPAPTKGL